MRQTDASPLRNWTPDRLPDLTGKTYIITGGNSGIGFEAAKLLATHGANVEIACRDQTKAEVAVAEIASAGRGHAGAIPLDLADLSSVREAARIITDRFGKIDALVNNAGVMQPPYATTRDGFELQFGVNHLAHFLLSGLLRGVVEAAGGRIVVTSSIAHKNGRINFDDLNAAKRYSATAAYFQSKLANLLFALELDRRLRAAHSPATALACHPGVSHTNLQSSGPRGVWKAAYSLIMPVMSQSAAAGAVPTVLAAAATEAKPGGYYGPTGAGEFKGPVGDAEIGRQALDREAARRLWDVSEELTGLSWELAPAT